MEDDVSWVASKLSSAASALGAKEIELRKWLLFFRCESEELRVVFARLADWMTNYYPPLGRISRTGVMSPSSA